MTVAELINELKNLLQDYFVYIYRTTDEYIYKIKEILSTDELGGMVVID